MAQPQKQAKEESHLGNGSDFLPNHLRVAPRSFSQQPGLYHYPFAFEGLAPQPFLLPQFELQQEQKRDNCLQHMRAPPLFQFQYAVSGSNWRSHASFQYRRVMTREIAKMLKNWNQKTGNVQNPEWSRKLPGLVKHMEVCLYRNAPSLDAYMDCSTLEQRLQYIAKTSLKKMNTQRSQGDAEREVKELCGTEGKNCGKKESSKISCSASKAWQNNVTMQHRRIVGAEIAKLLNQRGATAASSPEGPQKLHRIVKHLERSLFRSASSLEEYLEICTLERRLRKIALKSQKTKFPSQDEDHSDAKSDLDREQTPLSLLMNESRYGWQSPADSPQRARMYAIIIGVLTRSTTNSFRNTEIIQKLPEIAANMEILLYLSAPSLTAYSDLSTLVDRMQKVEKGLRQRNLAHSHKSN